METKNNSFLVSKQESIREEEEEEEEEEKEGGAKQRYGSLEFGMELYGNSKDVESSMILYKNYLGMDC